MSLYTQLTVTHVPFVESTMCVEAAGPPVKNHTLKYDFLELLVAIAKCDVWGLPAVVIEANSGRRRKRVETSSQKSENLVVRAVSLETSSQLLF